MRTHRIATSLHCLTSVPLSINKKLVSGEGESIQKIDIQAKFPGFPLSENFYIYYISVTIKDFFWFFPPYNKVSLRKSCPEHFSQ